MPAAVVCLAAIVSMSACGRDRRGASLDVATAAIVKESGLLDVLVRTFRGATIHAHAAGSDGSLELLADGVVDAALTNAPDTEARYLAAHPDWAYRKFAFNRFIVVGPPEDPAQVRTAGSVGEAFQRIAHSPMPFFSRGAGSGTYEREQALWKAAGVKPPSERLVVTASGMATTLKYADERQGYTLSDQGSFWQMESRIDLVKLFDHDPRLTDTYAIVYPRENALAARFAEWLARGEGRTAVAGFNVEGHPVFVAWPSTCPAERPDSQPCAPAPANSPR